MGCGGGGGVSVPKPSAQELAIQNMTYNNLMQQQAYYSAMEPHMLEQMGLRKTQTENPEYQKWLSFLSEWKQNHPTHSEQYIKDAYGRYYGALPSQYVSSFEKMSDADYYGSLNELEKLQYDASKLQAEQYQKALKGELPLSQAVENELAKQRSTLESYMSRKLGPNWQQSTPGIQALAEFDKQANALREEQMFGKQTGASAMSIAQQQAYNQQLQQQLGNTAQFPAYNSGLFGLASSALQPYQAQRQMQLQANAANSQNSAGLMSGLGGLLGTGMMAGATYFGLGAGRSSTPQWNPNWTTF